MCIILKISPLKTIILFLHLKILEYLLKKNILKITSWGMTEIIGYKKIINNQNLKFKKGKIIKWFGKKMYVPITRIDDIRQVLMSCLYKIFLLKLIRGLNL